MFLFSLVVLRVQQAAIHPWQQQEHTQANLILLGFNNTSTLVGHFVISQRKGIEIEQIVEEMKERKRKERGTGVKMKR